MTKKLSVFFIVLLMGSVLVTPVQAQEEESDSEPVELHLFRGGYMDLNFGLNLNMVGSSLGSGSMGGLMTSRIYNGALNVNVNPAMLAFTNKGQVIFDSRVGLGSNLTSGINSSLVSTINDEIESNIDETFSDEDSWTQFPETYIKPTEVRDLDAGLSGNLASMAFAAPVHDRVVIGGSFHYPAAIDFDLGVTGIAAKLAQEQGTDEVAIRFDVLMNVSLLTKMRFEMSKM